MFHTYWCLSPDSQNEVSVCSTLLCFMPANKAYPCSSRMLYRWVTAAPCCISTLLIKSVHCFSGCEWLHFLTGFKAWWGLSLALQTVSSCRCWLSFKPDDANPWHSSLWVAAFPHWPLSLMRPILGPPVCGSYSFSLDLKPDDVILGSSVCEWLQFFLNFKSEDAYPWLSSRVWVAAVSLSGF